MTLDADLTSCARLVERGDPLRFRTAMMAPLEARKKLFALYAFNVEVSRAPWVTKEPMIAEMRLQWWRDVLEEIAQGGDVRRHEVATPLSGVITAGQARRLDELIVARRWDIYTDAFEDADDFARYIDSTAGHLMLTATELLGDADEEVVRNAGYAAGVAAWLQALPALEEAGRVPLLDGTPSGISALARAGTKALKDARGSRAAVSRRCNPALLPATAAEPVLRHATAHPLDVADGRLPVPGVNFSLRALTGRW